MGLLRQTATAAALVVFGLAALIAYEIGREAARDAEQGRWAVAQLVQAGWPLETAFAAAAPETAWASWAARDLAGARGGDADAAAPASRRLAGDADALAPTDALPIPEALQEV
jgi:hypothetical protein